MAWFEFALSALSASICVNPRAIPDSVAACRFVFFPSWSAISESCAFLAKFFRLCLLRLLLFKFFGCGLPRCALAAWRLCVESHLVRGITVICGPVKDQKEGLCPQITHPPSPRLRRTGMNADKNFGTGGNGGNRGRFLDISVDPFTRLEGLGSANVPVAVVGVSPNTVGTIVCLKRPIRR
jgi:hypothetical protein